MAARFDRANQKIGRVVDAQQEVGRVLAWSTQLLDGVGDEVAANSVGGRVDEQLCLALAEISIERPHGEPSERRAFGVAEAALYREGRGRDARLVGADAWEVDCEAGRCAAVEIPPG